MVVAHVVSWKLFLFLMCLELWVDMIMQQKQMFWIWCMLVWIQRWPRVGSSFLFYLFLLRLHVLIWEIGGKKVIIFWNELVILFKFVVWVFTWSKKFGCITCLCQNFGFSGVQKCIGGHLCGSADLWGGFIYYWRTYDWRGQVERGHGISRTGKETLKERWNTWE